MSKVLCFVFAIAILTSAAKAEFVPFVAGSPVQTISGESQIIPTAGPSTVVSTTGSGANPYDSLVVKLGSKVGGLNGAQTESANAITSELNQFLAAKRLPVNINLAAYLLATAYVDSSLIPTEEILLTGDKAAIQATYFKYGYQGRGYVPFTGAFNYNRFAKDLNLAIDYNPSLLLDKTIAAKVLVFGAVTGRFTGFKIERFIPATGVADFMSARKSINGDINAASIAKLASDVAN